MLTAAGARLGDAPRNDTTAYGCYYGLGHLRGSALSRMATDDSDISDWNIVVDLQARWGAPGATRPEFSASPQANGSTGSAQR